MARSHVLSKPVTGWEVGFEDRADSPTFYAHRRGTAHVIAAIDFDLLTACSEKQFHHRLDSKSGLVALRAAARLRLTHVVRALGIARLVSVDIIDASGGYACEKNSDPKLHRIAVEFPIGVYVQHEGSGAEWRDKKAGRLNAWEHPSDYCPVHGGHDWIRASAWSSNGIQLEAIDSSSERESIRFALVSLIERVYGTRISTWSPSFEHRRYAEDFAAEYNDREEQLQWEEADLSASLRYAASCETQLGYALCSDLLGFVLPGEDRKYSEAVGRRIWSSQNEVLSQLQALATKHGCDIGDVRDIALWLDADRADHDPPRAAEHGPYDLCVDVAEAFGLDYDRAELAQLRRLADGPDTF